MDLNQKIQELLNNPEDSEEFTRLFSLVENWDVINKGIKVPQHTLMSELDCPECPHCGEPVHFRVSFSGYTADLNIDYGEYKGLAV